MVDMQLDWWNAEPKNRKKEPGFKSQQRQLGICQSSMMLSIISDTYIDSVIEDDRYHEM